MTKKTTHKKTVTQTATPAEPDVGSRLQALLFFACAGLLIIVPLLFSTAFHSTFVQPKFIALVCGTAIIILLLALVVGFAAKPLEQLRALKSSHLTLALLYLLTLALATYFGVSPRTSFFGSYDIQMGWLTYCGFLIGLIGLILACHRQPQRLEQILWAMVFTATLTAAYALVQAVGKDPFLPMSAYLFASPKGDILRVPGTLGHANYLGKFLLYTTPLGVSLTLISSGRRHRLALIATALAVLAIVLSGTRGAWVGAIFGLLTFVWLRREPTDLPRFERRQLIKAALLVLVVAVAFSIFAVSPVGHSVFARAVFADGVTGSGRTLLWRDALNMVPAYALNGCGPEGFRKAFLAYKSTELALYAPQNNNESSHNIYLDAIISYGLFGAIFYIALIASAFRLLWRSYRRVTNRRLRLLIVGMLSSLVAVGVHNFFIYDQIATGLYFFAFMALAVITAKMVAAQENAHAALPLSTDAKASQASASTEAPQTKNFSPTKVSEKIVRQAARALALAAIGAMLFAGWYAINATRTDMAIKRALQASTAKDLEGLQKNGEQAVRGINPINAYDYLYAQGLSEYLNRVQPLAGSTPTANAADERTPERLSALAETAMRHGEKALTHTLTPESNYVLLAYLARYANDKARLRQYAEEAVKWDNKFFSTHLMMAEALLANGAPAAALQEGEEALRWFPSSGAVLAFLTRAHDEQTATERDIQEWLMRGKKAIKKGRFERAKQFLQRAIRSSANGCPPGHQLLATLYEKLGDYEQAIREWEIFSRESPQTASTTAARIDALKQKLRLPK
ncbi:MAG: O-antigen ligase family protein [Acidobacteria bacterium]|nr:O-antigen ligase family protein [Acidobacteriota bacterium]